MGCSLHAESPVSPFGNAGASDALGSTFAMKLKLKVEPVPTTDSAQQSPPMSCARDLEMASPRPVPPCDRVIELSTCEKLLKSEGSFSGGMPPPVSTTSIWTRMSAPSSPSPVVKLQDALTLPEDVNLFVEA